MLFEQQAVDITVRDAYVTGQKLFNDKLFSIQEVVETPVDLGYFSYAGKE
jgi:hypothetical protein